MALRRWIATVIALLAGVFFSAGWLAGSITYELALLIAGLHPNGDDDNDPTDGTDLD